MTTASKASMAVVNNKQNRMTAQRQKATPVQQLPLSAASREILGKFQLSDLATHLLRRAHFAAEELFAQEFAEESITPRQKAALVMLYQNPGISQNALADQLYMDRNTVAEMVKRMSAGGLMVRLPSPSDQRAYELFLAPDGAALLDRVMPRDWALEQRFLDRLPVEYRALFIKCMHLIIDPPRSQDRANMPVTRTTGSASKRSGNHSA